MRYVAETEDVTLVDAFNLFKDHLEDLRSHRLYADEVRFYEKLYGVEAMRKRTDLYATTDGCHPNRAGHSLIVAALHTVLAGGGW
jgi:lysophospholipase L1-like esterase